MKLLLATLTTALLAGCATNSEWFWADERYGLKPGDPCFRCGEKIIVIPSGENEAQIRRARGERW